MVEHNANSSSAAEHTTSSSNSPYQSLITDIDTVVSVDSVPSEFLFTAIEEEAELKTAHQPSQPGRPRGKRNTTASTNAKNTNSLLPESLQKQSLSSHHGEYSSTDLAAANNYSVQTLPETTAVVSTPQSLANSQLYSEENLSNQQLTQGVLLELEDLPQTEERGWGVNTVQKITGTTYRQLDVWDKKNIVKPTITSSHGSGSRRLYSFRDIIILRIVKKLRDFGVEMAKIKQFVDVAQRVNNKQFSDIAFIYTNKEVQECYNKNVIVHLFETGQDFVCIQVKAEIEAMRNALENEEYVDLRRNFNSAIQHHTEVHDDDVEQLNKMLLLRQQRALQQSAQS